MAFYGFYVKTPRKAGTDTPFKLPKGESVPIFRPETD